MTRRVMAPPPSSPLWILKGVRRWASVLEFRKFLDTIDHAIPPTWAVRLSLDNYGTPKTALIQRWLVKPPRFHVRFTPASASWLNLVERCFGLLTQKQIRRGAHASTPALERAIYHYLEVTNQHPQPFVWAQTPDEILANIARFCNQTPGTTH